MPYFNSTTSVGAKPDLKSVGSPIYEQQSMLRHWRRARAVLSGELFVKEHDSYLDTVSYTNLLVPFHPSMTQEQYRWYVAEAQLPGLVAQYRNVLIGGLLRKTPELVLPDSMEQHREWIENYFTEDGRPLIAFITEALEEELISQRCWVSVDYPAVNSEGDSNLYRPYPVVWKAEDIINWQTSRDPMTGRPRLSRVVFKYVSKLYSDDNIYHPELVPTVAEHYLDENGDYQTRVFQQKDATVVQLANGEYSATLLDGIVFNAETDWQLVSETTPMRNGEPLGFLPIFPLNGEVTLKPPMLAPLIDKEIALYNKVSRRNHLLYGAATYTPVINSDMPEEAFEQIVAQGLGTWIKLNAGDTIDAFRSPSEALSDYDIAIKQDIEELQQLGLRILQPEQGESGIALSIRNSTQLAQLGLLNARISQSVKQIIAIMLEWHTGEELPLDEIKFSLSADFDPTPLGGDWMRMVSEWYQSRLIPRSLWLRVAKMNDIIPSDYDDEEGLQEISSDPIQSQFQDYSQMPVEE